MRWLAFGTVALWMGCLPPISEEQPPSGSDDTAGVVDTDFVYTGPTYHRDVAPILANHCSSCHTPGKIGGFALSTYADVVGRAYAVQAAVAGRTMPPWSANNDGSCNTFDGARWLSDAEILTITDWVYGGAVEGNSAEAPAAVEPSENALESVSATLDIGVSYTPSTAATDDYRCFVADPGLTAEAYLTGFEVKPGDARVVHHVVLFDVATESLATVQALDEADPAPGYSCFGDSGANGQVLLAWAPGSTVTNFPAGTGLLMSPDRTYVLQIHYNTAAGAFPDRTRVDLQLESSVDHPAGFLFAVDMGLELEPGQSEVASVLEVSVADLFEWFGWGTPEALTLHGLFPHLHLLGRSITVERVREEASTCLLDVPTWDFHWQEMYFYQGQPIDLLPTDRVRVRCTFDTASATETVRWGEGTGDEMCVAGLYVSRTGG
jgi:hypothetical protein